MNKYDILKHLAKSDDYVSGEALSQAFGVSRQSIWKHVNALIEEGYQIESVRRKGHKLIEGEALGKNSVAQLLKQTTLFESAQYYDQIDSTNSFAKRNADALTTAIIVSAEQTAGRGRLGRTWQSSAAAGLYFSLLLRPDIAPHLASMLTQLAALAMRRAIERTHQLKTQIKWPNDIYYNDKKLCGILTEMATEMNAVEYVVVGVGVNLKQLSFEPEIADIATSIAAHSDCNLSRTALLKAFIVEFEALYNSFLDEQDLAFVGDELNANSYVVGKNIWLIDGTRRQAARAKAINEMGELVVDQAGEERKLYYGEVSIRLNERNCSV